MGRVKKYSRQHSNRHKKHIHARKVQNDSDNETMTDRTKVLPVEKRKQIFKKKDRREVKRRIEELRKKSLKLKKRKMDQKAEKKEIAHEISALKKQLKTDGCSDSNSDEE